MRPNIISLPKRARHYLSERADLRLIRSSGLFDSAWYLDKNPDVAQAQADPLLHYLHHGGFEGRDPGPNFSSVWYLQTYDDVKKAGINPLLHYVRHGRHEGREASVRRIDTADVRYECPVCESEVIEFLPIESSYGENGDAYGHPFTADDYETMNAQHYQCPVCGASDRDRLSALYMRSALNKIPSQTAISVLDVAPSQPLRTFLLKYPNLKYYSADKYMADVDLVIDIEHMDTLDAESFELFICSHVLEHVADDRQALHELYRILKPRGWGILMVPINLRINEIDEDPLITDIGERWRRFGQGDHVRLYSKRGFVERVRSAGFGINQYGVDHFGGDAFVQHGISPGSILYIVEKRMAAVGDA